MSSVTNAEASDRIISSSRLLDFHVVSKVPVVDTEDDPPQQNSRPIRLRIVSPRSMTKNLFFGPSSLCVKGIARKRD